MTTNQQLREAAEKATPGPWYEGHLCRDDHPCNCPYILSEGYAGSVAIISVDNGLGISDGGNDAPPLEEAKANQLFIALANPQTILSLLDQLSEAEEAVEAVRRSGRGRYRRG